MSAGRDCAWNGCAKTSRARSDYCSHTCADRARRDARLTPEQREERDRRGRITADQSKAKTQRAQAKDKARSLRCVVCAADVKRSTTGRIAKVCSESCRMKRKRERGDGIVPGGISQFIRYAGMPSGSGVPAERFYIAYVDWARGYGVEPLRPRDMLPGLHIHGYRIEGSGQDERVMAP